MPRNLPCGTHNKYVNRACRCDACRNAARQYYSARQDRPGIRECDAEKHRTQRKLNRDKFRDRDLRRKYGIGLEDRDALLADQDAGCGICGTRDFGVKGPSIDHDHETGMIRRVLCVTCNTGLGAFKDDPALLERASIYIQYFKHLHALGGGARYVPSAPDGPRFQFTDEPA